MLAGQNGFPGANGVDRGGGGGGGGGAGRLRIIEYFSTTIFLIDTDVTPAPVLE
jgi:hypothetical protein